MPTPIGLELRRARRHLVADEQVLAFPLDLPTRNRIEGGRPHRLTSREIETRMVKRAANRASDNESVGEGTVVVGTVSTNGEESFAGSNEHHFLIADASADDATIAQGLHMNTGCQIDAHWIPHATSRQRADTRQLIACRIAAISSSFTV
jgi:hypothetical protein